MVSNNISLCLKPSITSIQTHLILSRHLWLSGPIALYVTAATPQLWNLTLFSIACKGQKQCLMSKFLGIYDTFTCICIILTSYACVAWWILGTLQLTRTHTGGMVPGQIKASQARVYAHHLGTKLVKQVSLERLCDVINQHIHAGQCLMSSSPVFTLFVMKKKWVIIWHVWQLLRSLPIFSNKTVLWLWWHTNVQFIQYPKDPMKHLPI